MREVKQSFTSDEMVDRLADRTVDMDPLAAGPLSFYHKQRTFKARTGGHSILRRRLRVLVLSSCPCSYWRFSSRF